MLSLRQNALGLLQGNHQFTKNAQESRHTPFVFKTILYGALEPVEQQNFA
jgi:hypothetical protein